MKEEKDESLSNVYGGLQINLVLKKSTKSILVELKGFNDLDVLWLNKIYRSYEGHVWTKFVANKNRKQFQCLLCNKMLYSFGTLRSHINIHLEIFPFKCFACERKYASTNSLYKHRKAKHELDQ